MVARSSEIEINVKTNRQSQEIAKLLPKSLDDIVRKNRDQLRLEYLKLDDLSHINKPLTITNLLGTLEDSFLYTRIVKGQKQNHAFLVGYLRSGDEKIAYHTSPLKFIDFSCQAVLTASGSNYIIKNLIEDNPGQNLLMHICAIAYRDGWGEHFDVPHFFY